MEGYNGYSEGKSQRKDDEEAEEFADFLKKVESKEKGEEETNKPKNYFELRRDNQYPGDPREGDSGFFGNIDPDLSEDENNK